MMNYVDKPINCNLKSYAETELISNMLTYIERYSKSKLSTFESRYGQLLIFKNYLHQDNHRSNKITVKKSMSLAITACFHVSIIYKQFIYTYNNKNKTVEKIKKPKKNYKISMFYLDSWTWWIQPLSLYFSEFDHAFRTAWLCALAWLVIN